MLCFPTLLLALAILATAPAALAGLPDTLKVALVLGATGWVPVARYLRGEFMRLRGSGQIDWNKRIVIVGVLRNLRNQPQIPGRKIHDFNGKHLKCRKSVLRNRLPIFIPAPEFGEYQFHSPGTCELIGIDNELKTDCFVGSRKKPDFSAVITGNRKVGEFVDAIGQCGHIGNSPYFHTPGNTSSREGHHAKQCPLPAVNG